MDLDLLKDALDNEKNLSIINKNIQEIKMKKNDILQQLGITREDLINLNKQLKDYIYIDNINDLNYGSNIRMISLQNISDIKLSKICLLCNIKMLKNGIGIVLKNFQKKYFTTYFDKCLIFQKLTIQEKIILKALNTIK